MLFGLGVLQGFSQSLYTFPPLTGNNGSAGVTFNLKAYRPIILDSIYVGLSGPTGTDQVEVWYNSTPISGQPNITTSTGWTLMGTYTASITNTGLAIRSVSGLDLTAANFRLNAGQEYGFYVGNVQNSTMIYTTHTAAFPDTFVNNDVKITSGPQTGYGGGLPQPFNSPRCFTGGIAYHSGQGTDLGVASLVSPSAPFVAGSTRPVTITLSNQGTTAITSASLGYQLNNNTAVTAPWTGNLAAGASTTYTFSTNITLPSTGTHSLKTWAANANGSPDVNPNNDTLRTKLCFGLTAGTYTVGARPTANYQTLQDAIAALNCGGGTGAITFELDSGTYTGNFVVQGPISGNPSISITQNGVLGDVIIQDPTGPTTSSASIIKLSQVSDFSLSNIVFKRNGSAGFGTPSAIIEANDGDNIEISQCRLIGGSGFGTDYSVFFNNTSNSRTIDCFLDGGVSGIFYTSSTQADNNSIFNNRIENLSNSAIQLNNQTLAQVNNNSIKDVAGFEVIRVEGGFGNQIYDNKMSGDMAGSVAVSLNNVNGQSGDPTQVYNNAIQLKSTSFFGAPSVFSIFTDSTDGPDYLQLQHNTVAFEYSLTPFFGTSGMVSISEDDTAIVSLGHLDVLNNIFMAKSDTGFQMTTDFRAYNLSSLKLIDSMNIDYNDYFIGANLSDFAFIDDATPITHTTLFDWKNGTNQDANSDSLNPRFISNALLIPIEGLINNSGTPSFVTNDITGAVRSATTPDYGAYEFTPSPTEISISSILGPVSGCGLGNNDTVVALVEHLGTNNLNQLVVRYTVNGALGGTDTLTGPIAPGAKIRYAFRNRYNFSTVGTYAIKAYVSVPVDNLPLNDTASYELIHFATVSAPDTQRFDASAAWITYGNANSWAHGAPNGTVINTSVSAPNVWTNNLTGDYNDNEQSYIQSPCYNLTGLRVPMVGFSLAYESETNYDGMVLEASTDGGGTWNVIGGQSSGGTNWYNANITGNHFSGDCWNGSNNTWTTAKHPLSALGNASSVIFRFHFFSDGSATEEGFAIDNFAVYDSLGVLVPTNAAMVSLDSPTTACGLGASERVVARVVNFGTAPLSNIPVRYSISGATTFISAVDTIRGPLAPNASTTHTFSTRTNLSASGTYNFKVYTQMPGDNIQGDDTVFATIINSQINTFSHLQTFDGGTSGNGATPGIFPIGWTFKSDSSFGRIGYSWFVNNGPTSSFATGPNQDHTTGSGNYVYTEASNGNTGDSTFLYSPCLNLTSLTSPRMSYWYHMAGANMGDLYVQYENNGQWVTFDSILGQQQTNETDPWLERKVSIPARGNTKIRFKGIRGSSFDGDMAIDDVKFFDGTGPDLELKAILRPSSGCGLSANDTVEIRVSNVGTVTQSNIPVAYKLNASAAVVGNIAGPLAGGATATYKFPTTVNLSTPGAYQLLVYVGAAQDSDRTNDTLRTTLVSARNITTLPDSEFFDNNNGGWVASGKNSSWAHGIPGSTTINSAVSTPNVWKTNLTGSYNDNEESEIVSPCYDLSRARNPKVRFQIWYETENNYDLGILESTTDNGVTWTLVNDSNSSFYNYSMSRSYYTGPCWNGATGAWTQAEANISSLAGQSRVRFRFRFISDGSVNGDGVAIDNFAVYDSLQGQPQGYINLMSARIVSPSANSFIDSAIVSAVVKNMGNVSRVLPFDFNFSVNGGLVQTQSLAVGGTGLLPGDSVIHSFSIKYKATTPGAQRICVFVSPVDTIRRDDTLCITLYSRLGTGTWTSQAEMYPNPTKGQVWLRIPEATGKEVQVSLQDLSGRRIMKKVISSAQIREGFHLNLDVPSGMYLIRVENETGRWSEKLLVE